MSAPYGSRGGEGEGVNAKLRGKAVNAIDRFAPTPDRLERLAAAERAARKKAREAGKLTEFTPEWATPGGRKRLPKKPPGHRQVTESWDPSVGGGGSCAG